MAHRYLSPAGKTWLLEQAELERRRELARWRAYVAWLEKADPREMLREGVTLSRAETPLDVLEWFGFAAADAVGRKVRGGVEPSDRYTLEEEPGNPHKLRVTNNSVEWGKLDPFHSWPESRLLPGGLMHWCDCDECKEARACDCAECKEARARAGG